MEFDAEVKARVPASMKNKLAKIATTRRSPGRRVKVSDIVREAIIEYLERQIAPSLRVAEDPPGSGSDVRPKKRKS